MCQIRAGVITNSHRIEDIAIFGVYCEFNGQLGHVDYEKLLCQMLNYGVRRYREFEVLLEFDFLLSKPHTEDTQDAFVTTRAPTPIRGILTPVSFASQRQASYANKGRSDIPLVASPQPAGSAAPKNTSNPQLTRKSPTNTMEDELQPRYEAITYREQRTGERHRSMLWHDLRFRWKCFLPACKNRKSKRQDVWCFVPEGESKHYPHSVYDLLDWGRAIRDDNATLSNPHMKLYRKWIETATAEAQETNHYGGQLPLKGRHPRGYEAPIFYVNINNNSNNSS